ncbi:MAG TPA: AI-2E family transporter [Geminicoccaceae bacterium]
MAEVTSRARNPSADPLRVVADAPAAERSHRWLRVIGFSTGGVLLLGIFYTLYFAKTIFVPFVLAFLLNLLLSPVVRKLARLGIPEALGAAAVLLLMLAAVGTGVFQLSGPATDWFERAPYTFARFELRLREFKAPMEEIQQATKKLEQLANGGQEAGAEDPETVVVQGPSIAETFVVSTYSIVAAIVITIVLLYFLLASGDLFLRKLVQVLPRLHDKKRAIEIARQCEKDISAYLLTITCVNAALGVVVGAAMWAIGMPNPVLWGVLAGVLNYMPYLGPTVMIGVLTLVSMATFYDWADILAPPAIFLLLTSLEGNLITPSILGRRLTLNPVVIFGAILVWGFLWGIPGVLIAVPLLAALKILCDNIPPLYAVGQFLGRREQDAPPAQEAGAS